MQIRVVLKMINLLLSLGAFIATGALSLMAGEDPLWTVGKAVASFVVCWVVLGWLSNVLFSVVESVPHAGAAHGLDQQQAKDELKG